MDPKSAMPQLDEHIVPEGSREEVLRGHRIIAAPAEAPHAELHGRLNYLMSAAAAPGCVASSDLLTRAGPNSEFATDTSVRREGIDPATGTRYLEALAFEIVSTQSLHEITMRAEDLSDRGVRRVIAVFVEKGEVAEWSASAKCWTPISTDSSLDDPTLVRPVSIPALFDARIADNAVVDALVAKRNLQLAQREAAEFEQSYKQGLQEGIEAICEVLGICLGPAEMTHLRTLDAAGLESLLAEIETQRRWPRDASRS